MKKFNKILIPFLIFTLAIGYYFLDTKELEPNADTKNPKIEQQAENSQNDGKDTNNVASDTANKDSAKAAEEKEKQDKPSDVDKNKDKDTTASKDKDAKEGSTKSENKDLKTTDTQAAKGKEQKTDTDKKPAENQTNTSTPKKKEKDKYLTDPVPEGKPTPVEPQDVKIGNKKFTATLSIRCDTLLDNLDTMNQEKVELVPADGVIMPATKVTFLEGESVFDVLKRETKERKIHMEFSFTPMYNSAYIEGIHNLYEFDGGNLSGWMYKVNGWFPNYGASRYQLKDGDLIEWVYTCDLGRDVGGYVPE